MALGGTGGLCVIAYRLSSECKKQDVAKRKRIRNKLADLLEVMYRSSTVVRRYTVITAMKKIIFLRFNVMNLKTNVRELW